MKEILEGIAKFVNGALGPLGAADPNYGWPDWIRDFLVQMIALLVLFLVVRFFLWKPISAFLAKKAAATDQELVEAKALNEENKRLNLELQDKMANAQNEIKDLLAKANIEGQKKKEEIINAAKEEAIKRIEDATVQIELEVKRQKEDIRQAIVDIAFLAASKIAEKEVDRNKYLSLVEEIIESGIKDE